ncbi:AsnC family transcriptional regulator [Anaerospora sp.]|uniref:siroheme decarboxylase subunit alpha n=1 Tax=Anaerospora sp. TaxID=1960278 RepID=UPI0028968A41|nr:AsnC family transcriptional regulator [Anaerospora sp.]
MLTSFDKALLNIVQTDLPLTKRPFADLAARLDAEEATVLERLRYLKDNGYIRRMGPFFDSNKLGYLGTLVAAKVAPEKLAEVARFINEYPGVTHNYEREGEFNLWFALLTPDLCLQEQIIAVIQEQPGVQRIINLPATKKYKVSVQFRLE